MLTLYEFCHEVKQRSTNQGRRLSLMSLPITNSTPTLMSSSASIMTMKSTHITTIDGGGGFKARGQRRKKFPFFRKSADDTRNSDGSKMSSHLQALKGSNGSRVSIGLCGDADLEDQRSASALTTRGEGDGEKGILMTTTVTVMREEGP